VNVPNRNTEALAGDLEQNKMPVGGTPFWRGVVACSGTEFCKVAITETKSFSRWLVEELEERLPGFEQGGVRLGEEALQAVAPVRLGDAERALHESGADGVMIGRGAYGRPWFVGQVIEWLRTRRRLPDPPLANQYATLRAHYDAMLSHYGNDVGVKIARKHIGWYSKGLPDSAEFRAAVNQTVEPDAVRRLIRAYYEPLVEREAA